MCLPSGFSSFFSSYTLYRLPIFFIYLFIFFFYQRLGYLFTFQHKFIPWRLLKPFFRKNKLWINDNKNRKRKQMSETIIFFFIIISVLPIVLNVKTICPNKWCSLIYSINRFSLVRWTHSNWLFVACFLFKSI